VNNAVLGVTLPIGVACRPPNALSVVIAVMDAFDVNAAAVMLPAAPIPPETSSAPVVVLVETVFPLTIKLVSTVALP
jgi:hypothetical protein